MEIKTNNRPRDVLYFHELTQKEQAEFSHEDRETCTYFRYKGYVYLLDDFVRCPPDLSTRGWHGCHADSFFSGTVIKYTQCNERVIVGWYCC